MSILVQMFDHSSHPSPSLLVFLSPSLPISLPHPAHVARNLNTSNVKENTGEKRKKQNSSSDQRPPVRHSPHLLPMFPTTPPGSAPVISMSVVPTQGKMPLGSPDFPAPPSPSSPPALESRLSSPRAFDKTASRMLPICRPNPGLPDQCLMSLTLPPPFPQLGVRPTAPRSCCLSFETLS